MSHNGILSVADNRDCISQC